MASRSSDESLEGAAALDLVAAIESPLLLMPGAPSVFIPTGISVFLNDPMYVAMICPRSGLGHKRGLVLGNGIGIIDSDYQGELFISENCIRPGHTPLEINRGDRIAQLLITPVMRAKFSIVEEFNNQTIRGSGGFGSTGT